MADGKGLSPAKGVRLRPVEDEGILFDARRRTVYFLNTTATVIWCRIESGEDPFAGLDAEEARNVFSQWRALGLLADSSTGAPPPLPRARSRRHRGSRKPAQLPSPPAMQRRYRLLGVDFSLAFDDARLDALVHPTLAHLEIPASAAGTIALSVDRHGDLIRLAEGGRLLDTCASPSEIAPLVKLHAAQLAVSRFPHRLALHAAAVANAGGVLLLPAAAGSGKSVLATALMRRGWRYGSDDTTLVDGNFAVTGLPYSITVKQGAWSLVGNWFPDLLQQPVHMRPDHQAVRYLAPRPPLAETVGPAARVRWIAYPRYAESAPPAELSPAKLGESLRKLLANGGWVRPLGWRQINRTIDWLAGIERFHLAYSDADAAAAAVEARVRGR